MLRLRDIMATDVATVSPQTSVREAMEMLALRHVSGAPVLSAGKLVGVVTGTDLMAFASALPGVPTERDTHDEWELLGEVPTDREVEVNVEREDESPSAYFSDLWDDSGAEVTERIAWPASPEWNSLEEHDVSEVMTRTPLATLPPDADVGTAAEMMKRKGIHRVLVTEGDKLVGVVSSLDIARTAADVKGRRTYVFNRDRDFGNAE